VLRKIKNNFSQSKSAIIITSKFFYDHEPLLKETLLLKLKEREDEQEKITLKNNF
jgi:hypothetical protein